MWLVALIVFVLFMMLLIKWNQYSWIKKRQILIDTYDFPKSISEKVSIKYPHLSEEEVRLVISGLREYFHICNIAGKQMVSMPSQVVDVAWHEFILFTEKYSFFCNKAIGRFLHHTPAEAMKKPTLAQVGIKRAWRISCQRKGIDPSAATSLPILFSIDTMLKIDDGFKYSLDCTRKDGGDYCATHIGCSSGCSGGSGSGVDGGNSGSDGGGSGCGGGCGGS